MVWESEPGDGEVYEALTDSRPSAEAELVVIISLSSLINMPIKEIKQFLTTTSLPYIYFLPLPLTRGIASDIRDRPGHRRGRWMFMCLLSLCYTDTCRTSLLLSKSTSFSQVVVTPSLMLAASWKVYLLTIIRLFSLPWNSFLGWLKKRYSLHYYLGQKPQSAPSIFFPFSLLVCWFICRPSNTMEIHCSIS